ncbi:MAG: hypothetical protein ABEK01_01755 [Candidatus Nanohaloarchaea archaeon]
MEWTPGLVLITFFSAVSLSAGIYRMTSYLTKKWTGEKREWSVGDPLLWGSALAALSLTAGGLAAAEYVSPDREPAQVYTTGYFNYTPPEGFSELTGTAADVTYTNKTHTVMFRTYPIRIERDQYSEYRTLVNIASSGAGELVNRTPERRRSIQGREFHTAKIRKKVRGETVYYVLYAFYMPENRQVVVTVSSTSGYPESFARREVRSIRFSSGR